MFYKPLPCVLLSTAYLPNIQYLTKLVGAEQVVVEAHEHYQKQSFRNRCEIRTANGILPLTIPTERTHGSKTLIRDIRIDYQANWQTLHWRAIEAAYRSSPFFEYYADDLEEFYLRRIDFLFDFNTLLLNRVTELIGIAHSPTYTPLYQTVSGGLDYRNSINPKARLQRADPYFSPVPYYQVFGGKTDFYPNLSILDLLCNEGNNTLSVLLASICTTSDSLQSIAPVDKH